MPARNPLGALYESVRYENARWPLWRWDQNLRYLAKSLWHRPRPVDPADQEHFQRMAAYLRRKFAGDRPSDATSREASNTGNPRSLRLCAGGDLMWIRSGWQQALSPAVKSVLCRADLTLANLETPIHPGRPVPRLLYETLRYNAPPEYLDPWLESDGDAQHAFSLCNNHALDQGIAGLRATRQVIAERPGCVAVGGVDAEDAVASVTSAGWRIALLGLTFGINHWDAPTAALPGAPALEGIPCFRFGDPDGLPDWDRLQKLIDRARAVGPDLVLLFAHWGFEYEYWPEALQRRQAQELIARGIDVVIGSSPHLLQPIELLSVDGWDPSAPLQLRSVRGRSGPRPGIIAYSLGNLASIMPTAVCQTGALLEIELRMPIVDGAPYQAGRSLWMTSHPTVCRRGLGAGWLDAQVQLAPASSRQYIHARAMLGA